MTTAVSLMSTNEAISILNELCPRAVRELASMLSFSPSESQRHITSFGYLARTTLVSLGAMEVEIQKDPLDSTVVTLTPFFFELVRAAHSHTA